MTAYSNDFDGFIHAYYADSTSEIRWGERLVQDNYLTTSSLCCPGISPYKFKDHNKVYGILMQFLEEHMAQLSGTPRWTYIATKSVKVPSSAFILTDSVDKSKAEPIQYGSMYLKDSNYLMHARHTNRVNMVFMDGHASADSPVQITGYIKIMRKNGFGKPSFITIVDSFMVARDYNDVY